MKYCSKCGKAVEDGVMFCTGCGNNMNGGAAPMDGGNDGKGASVAALVLGIVSIISFWIPYFNIVTLILGIIGIVMASNGSKAAKAVGAPTGLATAGLVLAIIGTVFAGIGFFSCTCPAVCLICTGAAGLSL